LGKAQPSISRFWLGVKGKQITANQMKPKKRSHVRATDGIEAILAQERRPCDNRAQGWEDAGNGWAAGGQNYPQALAAGPEE
jgi:hypothetical protein